MKISKSSSTGGAWLKKDTLRNGDKLKLVTEAAEVEGQNGTQLVAKCLVQGGDKEALNFSINNASKNALIDAFGDDSKDWMNKPLTVEVEKVIVAGKRGIAVYLVPAGFSVETDPAGYVVISRDPVNDLADTTEPYRGVEITPDEDIEIPF